MTDFSDWGSSEPQTVRDQIARTEAGTRLEAAVKRASRSLRLRNSLLTVAAIVAFVLLTTGLLLSKNSDTSTLGGKFLLSSVAVIVVAAVAYGMANYLQYGKIAVNQEAVGNQSSRFMLVSWAKRKLIQTSSSKPP